MQITVKETGIRPLRILLRRYPRAIAVDIRELDKAMVPIAQEAVRRRAPVRTGRYRASIVAELTSDGIIVSTDAPQAERLEYGFVGIDSLGRHYAQSPQPHWGPAAEELADLYVKSIRKIIVGRMQV